MVSKKGVSVCNLLNWLGRMTTPFDIWVSQSLNRINIELMEFRFTMAKLQDRIDALTARAEIQGETIEKIRAEVQALKAQAPGADLTALEAAFETNDERLASLDEENPDTQPPSDEPENPS